MIYPNSIEQLIESFKRLPGIGEKTAERLTFAVLDFEEDIANDFSDNIKNIKSRILKCSKCNTLTEDDLCFICKDKFRDKNIIMVVESSKDVFLFERMGNFKGYYHVLGGLISPLDEIGPDDIEIASLLKRLKENEIREVILAIKTSIEADTTALYIKKLLEKDNITVSRIASGVPIGADMDYVDALTLETALKNRKEIF